MAALMVGEMAKVDPEDVMRSLVERFSQKKMRASDFWKKIDTTGDGSLDADELRAGLAKEVDIQLSEAEFAVVMARVHKDGGGDVSLKEFDRAIKEAEKLPKKKVEEVQKKKQGITAEDKEEFLQTFCLLKQLTTKETSEDGVERLAPMDSTGSISVDELEHLLEGVGMKLGEDDIHSMITDLDKDGNGDIDFEEFCDAMAKEIQVEHEPEEIAKCFKTFAHHSPDGYMRVEDLRNCLTTHMHKDLSHNDVNELLQHYQHCFVRLPGHECEFFNYQDYIDLLSPLADHQDGKDRGRTEQG